MLYIFATVGVAMLPSETAPTSAMYVAMAVSLQIFVCCDVMDGIRARRQKSGSCFGRILDEGLDLIQ